MSYHALQRTLVRLLHDPTLVERFKRSGPTVLEEPELTPDELSWLEAADPRAFTTDPYRQGRVLTSLVEELPTASLLASSRLAGGLSDFFASVDFHQTVREDRPLRLGLGRHLAQTGEDARALVALETKLMEARREQARPTGELCVAQGVSWLRSPSGTLELYEALWIALTRTARPLVEAVLTVSRAQRPVTSLGLDTEEILLIEPDGTGGFHVGQIPSGLEAILKAAQDHGTRRACHEAAIVSGADADETPEIIDEMISEGLLAAHTP